MYEYKAKLVRVIDGDSIIVNVDMGFGHWMMNEGLRLADIDAPELRSSDPLERIFGDAAKRALQDMLGLPGSNLVIRSKGSGKNGRGSFGRLLAEVFVYRPETGQMYNAGEKMKFEGHAVCYHLPEVEKDNKHLQNREMLIETGAVDLGDNIGS